MIASYVRLRRRHPFALIGQRLALPEAEDGPGGGGG